MIRASLLIMVAMLTGCLTGQVQDRALSPAILSSWPDVRVEAERGGMSEARLADWDMAVEVQNFLGLDVDQLRDAAIAGADQRLIAGEVGPIGAQLLREQAVDFANAVEELRRVVLVSRADQRSDSADRPLVISRSSWANSPPPAIAGRVYR